MTNVQKNRLEKIEQYIEKRKPNRALKLLEGDNQAKQQIRTALIESFEQQEIGLTTDRIAQIIKDQIKVLLQIQHKINETDTTQYHKFYNPGLSIYASGQILSYITLLLKVRGDLNDTKMQLAQQINISNKGSQTQFEDYIMQLSLLEETKCDKDNE